MICCTVLAMHGGGSYCDFKALCMGSLCFTLYPLTSQIS